MKYVIIIAALLLCDAVNAAALAQSASDNEISIPLNADLSAGAEWFDGSVCPDGDKGLFHFQIGKQIFRVPSNAVISGGLAKAAVHGTSGPMESKFKMTARVTRLAGCQSAPLAFGHIALRPDGSIPNPVVLSPSQERSAGMPMVAKYIQHLQNIGSCKATKFPDLIACVGSRTENGKNINILFMVVSVDGAVAQSASTIPVHMRCDELGGRLSCMIADDFENDVTAKSLVDPRNLSGRDIRDLHDRLAKFVAERRVP